MGDDLHEELESINSNKAVFTQTYMSPDPRAYFSVLGSLDYMIPDVAAPIIHKIVAEKLRMHGGKATILDVGSSYGVNAAMHRFPVDFAMIRQRYARREMMELDAEDAIRLDRAFYSSWPDIGQARFVGLDVSKPAIHYANEVGLHVDGVTADLEKDELSTADAARIAPVNILLSTGSIGYVTDRTYRKLLDAVTEAPWIISFVLRLFPYDDLIETFGARGMTTERLEGVTFVQRRFRDGEEYEACLAALAARGIEADGIEADGLLHAELFLSRPEADAEAAPLEKMVTVSSGSLRSFDGGYVPAEDVPAG